MARLIGIAICAEAFGTVPIAGGVGAGAVRARLPAGTALSLPALIMLWRVTSLPLAALFTAIVTAGTLTIGFAFNAIAIRVI